MALPELAPDRGIAEAHQALCALQNARTVMCLAAHPDDEDSATLAYLEKRLGVRTVLVTFTRGEGGQNEIGPELGNRLAVIRAGEMNDIAALVGCELENLGAPEFGYSKTARETLSIWEREKLVRRLVFLIRTYQPDVIITHHDTVSGHGHHQATALIGLEAYDAAGDATRFPTDMLSGVIAWQPAAFFMRVSTDPPGEGEIVKVPVGMYDAVRGASYAEIGAVALKRHRSQGRWKQVDSIGKEPRYVQYQRVRAAAGVRGNESLFDGVERYLEHSNPERQRLAERISERAAGLERALLNGDRKPLLSALLEVRKELEEEAGGPLFVRRKWKEWHRAFQAVTGVQLEIRPLDEAVVSGQTFEVAWHLYNPAGCDLRKIGLRVQPEAHWAVVEGDEIELPNDKSGEVREAVVSGTLKLRAAYPCLPPCPPGANEEDVWEMRGLDRESLQRDADARLDALVHSREFGQPTLTVTANMEMGYLESGERISTPVADAAGIEVVPGVELVCTPEQVLVRTGDREAIKVRCEVRNRTPGAQRVVVQPDLPTGWTCEPNQRLVGLATEDGVETVSFSLLPSANAKSGEIAFQARDESETSVAEDRVGITPLRVRTALDIEGNDSLLVGIIRSYDDTLEAALATLDVPCESIESEMLLRGDLDRYDTILVDIRAYLVREDLRQGNQRLLDYVERGGVAIVFYQKVYEWNEEYGNPPFAPYALQICHDRVTVESAPITLLAPEHPLLSWPNRLGPDDWENWVQERGLYFAGEYDSKYEELLESEDPDEAPLRSGYLAANHGKGRYVYTGYVWYRQLRAGVPGGYRALANMVSLPKWPGP